MRVNTAKSMRLAERVRTRYGSWEAVRQASRLENGVYVIESVRARAPSTSKGAEPVKA